MKNEKRIEKVIREQVRKGKKDFIIFPYGKYGKIAEACLRKYNIEPKAVIDTQLSKSESNVRGLEFLRTKKPKTVSF